MVVCNKLEETLNKATVGMQDSPSTKREIIVDRVCLL